MFVMPATTSGRSSLPHSSHIGGVSAVMFRSGQVPGYTSDAKSSFEETRSIGSRADASPPSARVDASATSCPPAEKPMAPIFRLSADQPARERTVRIARLTSLSASPSMLYVELG